MRKLLWGLALALTASIVILACQKEVSSPENPDTAFNDKAAKDWYYGTFKKSAEWNASNEKGKKLPDWKHPFITKVGSNYVVEFPLNENTSSYSISSTGNNERLSPSQIKKVADASISRIAFIKMPDGKIIVREIDYIPEWKYLERKSFDISSVSILNSTNDFSGRIIVK